MLGASLFQLSPDLLKKILGSLQELHSGFHIAGIVLQGPYRLAPSLFAGNQDPDLAIDGDLLRGLQQDPLFVDIQQIALFRACADILHHRSGHPVAAELQMPLVRVLVTHAPELRIHIVNRIEIPHLLLVLRYFREVFQQLFSGPLEHIDEVIERGLVLPVALIDQEAVDHGGQPLFHLCFEVFECLFEFFPVHELTIINRRRKIKLMFY